MVATIPRHEVVTAQVAPDFFLDAGPGAVSEFSHQVVVEASVESQTLGNRQHNLPVRDRSTDFFGDMQCGQQLEGKYGGKKRREDWKIMNQSDRGNDKLRHGIQWIEARYTSRSAIA